MTDVDWSLVAAVAATFFSAIAAVAALRTVRLQKEASADEARHRRLLRLERILERVVAVQETAVRLKFPADARDMPVPSKVLLAPAANGLKAALASVPDELPNCHELALEFDVDWAINKFLAAFDEAKQAVDRAGRELD